MARIRIKTTEIRRGWRDIQDHLTRGDEVIVVHYNRAVALITPYQEDTVDIYHTPTDADDTVAKRFTTDADAKNAIAAALADSDDDYDIDAIFRQAYEYRVDINDSGQELLNTAGFEQVVSVDEFWEIVARHERQAE